MTRRLVLVIVATVAATLLLVGRHDPGLRHAPGPLADRGRPAGAGGVDQRGPGAVRADHGRRPARWPITAFRRALRLDGIELMTVTRGGRLLGNRPDGVPASALDPTALAAGTTESGRSGSLVWVADPVAGRATGPSSRS